MVENILVLNRGHFISICNDAGKCWLVLYYISILCGWSRFLHCVLMSFKTESYLKVKNVYFREVPQSCDISYEYVLIHKRNKLYREQLTWGSIPSRSFTRRPTVVMDSEAVESPNHIPILSPFGRTETTAPFTWNIIEGRVISIVSIDLDSI